MTVQAIELAPGITIGGDSFPFIAGPCVIESEELALDVARRLAAMSHRLGLPLVYKASFDKANRSSVKSYRGPGMREGLRVLRRVREETRLPILTDVHEPAQCEAAAEVCDVLQIPAFLCRQTDLVMAAARTGRIVNIKKGQFMLVHLEMWRTLRALGLPTPAALAYVDTAEGSVFYRDPHICTACRYRADDMTWISMWRGLSTYRSRYTSGTPKAAWASAWAARKAGSRSAAARTTRMTRTDWFAGPIIDSPRKPTVLVPTASIGLEPRSTSST